MVYEKQTMEKGSEWFYKMKTIRRLWFFYTVFFLFPLSIWTGFYFFQLHRNLIHNFQNYYSDLIASMLISYNDRLLRITNTVELFEGNRYFIDYVEDWYMPVAERVPSFNSDIRPLIHYVLSSNKLLEDVLIYSYRSPRIPPYYFINAWDDDFLPFSEIDALGPQEAAWQFDIGPGGTNRMRCYFPVYGGNYSSRVGCVILSINTEELFYPFQREAQNMKILLLRRGEKYILREGGFGPVSEEDAALADSLSGPPGRAAGNIRLVNKLSMGELDGGLYFFADLRYFSGEDIPALLIPIVLLLILLTSILFINFAAGTRRVSALARHFQTADYSNLTPLDRGRYTDEIGFLVECYNQMAENINHLVHDVYRAELKSRDARYYAIQAQLNPHFLLNSLENIRMIAMMHGDDETSGMIYQLARIMGYTIRQGSLISTLAQETEHCRNYLELCAMRMGSRFSYTITCPGELAGLVCPKFMLQPIVENAVEHAFTENSSKKQIDITVSPRDAGACILVRDNGRGIETERLAALRELLAGTPSPEEGKIHGIGIVNVHERLKIFYGAEYGLRVESDPESGTRFTLLIGSRPYPEMTVNQSPEDL